VFLSTNLVFFGIFVVMNVMNKDELIKLAEKVREGTVTSEERGFL